MLFDSRKSPQAAFAFLPEFITVWAAVPCGHAADRAHQSELGGTQHLGHFAERIVAQRSWHPLGDDEFIRNFMNWLGSVPNAIDDIDRFF